MFEYYKLVGKEAVPCSREEGVLEWGNMNRLVAKSHSEDKTVTVSTVFMPMNHAFDDGPPMVFETMIFGGEHENWMARCSTWAEAEAQHREGCAVAGVTSTV